MSKKLMVAILLAGLLGLPRVQVHRKCPECVDLPELRRVEYLRPADVLQRPEATCGRMVPR